MADDAVLDSCATTDDDVDGTERGEADVAAAAGVVVVGVVAAGDDDGVGEGAASDVVAGTAADDVGRAAVDVGAAVDSAGEVLADGELVWEGDVVSEGDGSVSGVRRRRGADGEVDPEDDVASDGSVSERVAGSRLAAGTSGNDGSGAPGAAVAAGSCASTLTVSSCHWLTSSCLRCTSSTVATVVVTASSLAWAPCQSPCEMSCWTCSISVWAARTTASSRVWACSPNSAVRRP